MLGWNPSLYSPRNNPRCSILLSHRLLVLWYVCCSSDAIATYLKLIYVYLYDYQDLSCSLTYMCMCLFLCNFVGVMLYELLALEPPFVKSSLSDLVKSILDDECPDIPAHYSSELKYVVLFNTDFLVVSHVINSVDRWFVSFLASFQPIV